MNKEAGRKIIAERVEEFEKNKAVLTKKGHGETNIRSNYIDIMFNALGWNMKSHYEVVREYSQRDKSTDAGTKKVDYAFKINGKLKFFIEAKEASVDLENDKARLLERPGEAIFNSTNGRIEGNNRFQIYWLDDEVRDEFLETANNQNIIDSYE